MAINAAAMDIRIKATAAMTMYDMTRVNANGYFDSENTEEARYEKKKAMNEQRTMDYKNGTYALAGGVVDPLPEEVPQFVKDYYVYYKTKRGYHVRSLNSNHGWNVTSSLFFMNMPILQYSHEIRSAVLIVHGEKAHSRYFGETAFEHLKGENKEFMIIPKSVHKERMEENFRIWDFSLSEEDMQAIAKLDLGHSEIVDHASSETAKWLNSWKIHD